MCVCYTRLNGAHFKVFTKAHHGADVAGVFGRDEDDAHVVECRWWIELCGGGGVHW